MATSEIPEKTLKTLQAGFHIQVLFINQISNADEPKASLGSRQLAQNADIAKLTLQDMRKVLGKKADSKWSFCLRNCAPVDGSSSLLYYLTLDELNVKKLQPPGGEKSGTAAAAYSLPLLTVYMAVGNAMAPAPKGSFGAEWALQNKLDNALTDRSASLLPAPTIAAAHKAEYLQEAQWSGESNDPDGPGMLDVVVDMADENWDKIMMLNKTLYGFDVRGDGRRLEITSARYPAFELSSQQLMMSGLHLRPFVEVHDTPHVDITEVKTAMQSSLVDNAFSAKAMEAMISGGTPLISASASAAVNSVSERGTGKAEEGSTTEYHATYNFPRVRLFLDDTTLAVSQYCDKAVMDLKAKPTFDNLRSFQRQFGVIFAQEVVLGGRLESSKSADSAGSSSSSSEKDALKASLGAAMNVGFVSASMTASSESQSGKNKEASQLKGNSAISYTARGGDTLLCADPAAWAATVAVWRNWRVIQQDEPITIQDLLGRFEKYKFVPELFRTILLKDPTPPKVAPPAPTEKVFNKSVPWDENKKLRLWIGMQQVPAWTMFVRDGDPSNLSAPPRKTLTADYPLMLFTKDSTPKNVGQDESTVYVNRQTGVLGPDTDRKGTQRFSLRREGASGCWQPVNGSNMAIANGDKVTLWCHSVGLGGWRSVGDPPSQAHQAVWNKATGELRFNVSDATSPVFGYQPVVFTVEFV